MQAGGPGWPVPTGRRDGRVSLASDATNLPGFRDSVDVQKQKFAAKGLDTQDLVALVGKDDHIVLDHKWISLSFLSILFTFFFFAKFAPPDGHIILL